MPTLVVVGTQWGDEAKGKIVDLLSVEANIVVRFAGGNNAGHTVLVGERLVKFHLLPAGLLRPHVRGILAAGTVICPRTLAEEIDRFGGGIGPDRLTVSPAAHVVFPYHSLRDAAEEERRRDRKLGTTKRGIGPAYADKVARIGMRMAEFVDDERREARLADLLRLQGFPLTDAPTPEAVEAEYGAYARRLRPYVGDAEGLVAEAVEAGRKVLFEGAHGTLLDIDSGTYPYVTSTHTTAGSACLGTGIGPRQIDHVLGIVKAYTTRVGEGPMPTELLGPEGEALRERGKEYGTATGRPRRCGWLDFVALKHAARVNGLSALAVTRLDVLSGYDELRICTQYELDGETTDRYPVDTDAFSRCKPVYETCPGWTEETSGCRAWEDLPQKARDYVSLIADRLGVPVVLVSVGAERDATVDCGSAWLWKARAR
jgi:adenylosuccinate synthase